MVRIYVNSISHSFPAIRGRLDVLEDISFEVGPSEVLTLVGPSGCGKSTLLRCAAGLITPSSGSILVGEFPPATLLLEKKIGFGFQEPALLPWRTVEQNVRLPIEIGPAEAANVPSAEYFERLLSITRLTSFRDYYPSQLSGGMRQRVALARSLLVRPNLLLLDEPLASLDLLTRTDLMVEMSSILAELECPTVIVTHSIDEAAFWGSKIAVLSDRPAKIIRTLTNATSFPRKLDHMDSDLFHKLTSECRKTIYSQKTNASLN